MKITDEKAEVIFAQIQEILTKFPPPLAPCILCNELTRSRDVFIPYEIESFEEVVAVPLCDACRNNNPNYAEDIETILYAEDQAHKLSDTVH